MASAFKLASAAVHLHFAGNIWLSCATSDFLSAGEVSREDAKTELLAELVSTFRPGRHHESRIQELEEAARNMYQAIPKDETSRIGHNVVRYALHRLLLQEHGWFVRGLEPEGQSWKNTTSKRLQEWVPSYLQDVLERRSHSHGFTLRELSVLAATIEDLVHREAIERLRGIYQTYSVAESILLNAEQAEELIDSFLMIYLRGGNFSAEDADQAWRKLHTFKLRYSGWKDVDAWARSIQKNTSDFADGSLDFEMATRVAEAIGSHFGQFNDIECKDLKQTLSVVAQKPGRVRLSTFYNMSLHSHWQFTEKVSYLRDIGALDESIPEQPMVIIPNYVGSRPQCLEASHFYAICCRNECEDLVNELERQVAAPTATTSRIAEVVKAFSTTLASRNHSAGLSPKLLTRLDQVAEANAGRVPLHGRLFAQWMHHAFPSECPYPHEAGTVSPQTPDEWMQGTGHSSTKATQEEMVCHVSGLCAGGAQALSVNSDGGVDGVSADLMDIPWSNTEELLVEQPIGTLSGNDPSLIPWKDFDDDETEEQSDRGLLGAVQAFNSFLRSLVLSMVALGLALGSKNFTRFLNSKPGKLAGPRFAKWCPTLLMLAFPLVPVTVDYATGSSTNELLLCGLCWGLAAMLAFPRSVAGSIDGGLTRANLSVV
eukprot:TRINITY_DN6487_c0_g1_i1.p1 TRINITY_DN6487_c0_g1~~TRINITY_DN6487_c0_g1_i1.p1  ORF type:complete len:656 (-),score=120.75 TRINITY_DN6487_c0_g1_i1:152-2119(-)